MRCGTVTSLCIEKERERERERRREREFRNPLRMNILQAMDVFLDRYVNSRTIYPEHPPVSH